MRFQQESKTNNSFLDIAPLVDTVFNLLIFFALSLNFVSLPGIRVQLPSGGSREVAQEKRDLRIVITERRRIYLNEKTVTPGLLRDRFRDAARAGGDSQVLIQADERAPHGAVVEVMDLARSAGLHRLAIVTQPKKSAPE